MWPHARCLLTGLPALLQVPLCDGTPQRSMATGTVAALGLSIIGIFLLAVAAVVVVRHRRLKKRVRPLRNEKKVRKNRGRLLAGLAETSG